MSADVTDRIISLTQKKSKHAARNAVLFVVGWVFLVAVAVLLVVVIVWPRTQGYVSMPYTKDSSSGVVQKNDLLFFQKVRQGGAQQLNPGDVISIQSSPAVEYEVVKIDEKIGQGDDTYFTVTYLDGSDAAGGKQVDLDMVRGLMKYKLPLFGLTYGGVSDITRSFVLIAVAQFLLIYAGWQVGTFMINSRDPQRQARVARLRTAALAGNLETTRQRLRRQNMR